MRFDNANCDLYIGTGAGKNLLGELTRAQHSVRIVSPFVSRELATELIVLHHRRLTVQLITSQTADSDRLLQTLVRRKAHTNTRALKNNTLLKLARRIVFVLLGVSAMGAYWFMVQQQIASLGITGAAILILLLGLLIIRFSLKRLRVTGYTYHPVYPIRMIRPRNEQGRRATFLHSKIYIIDDRTAYLGSLNFTRSGTQSNYETCIRFTDPETVAKIKEQFQYLWEDRKLPELDISKWGAEYFAMAK